MQAARKTLRDSVTFSGLSLHRGQKVSCTVHPGESGTWFRCGSERVQALAENVTSTPNCTVLGGIGVIEHLMSALAGLEITDAEVELDYPELPALDGSAKEFVQGLKQAGSAGLEPITIAAPFKRVYVTEGDAQVSLSAGEGHWRCLQHFRGRWPGEQSWEGSLTPAVFEEEICFARTFAEEEFVEPARAAGMGLGLTLESCLILGQDRYVNEARAEDEPVRHKVLDLMGDLALSGIPLRWLNVVAERASHKLNVAAALKLRRTLGLA